MDTTGDCPGAICTTGGCHGAIDTTAGCHGGISHLDKDAVGSNGGCHLEDGTVCSTGCWHGVAGLTGCCHGIAGSTDSCLHNDTVCSACDDGDATDSSEFVKSTFFCGALGSGTYESKKER